MWMPAEETSRPAKEKLQPVAACCTTSIPTALRLELAGLFADWRGAVIPL